MTAWQATPPPDSRVALTRSPVPVPVPVLVPVLVPVVGADVDDLDAHHIVHVMALHIFIYFAPWHSVGGRRARGDDSIFVCL